MTLRVQKTRVTSQRIRWPFRHRRSGMAWNGPSTTQMDARVVASLCRDSQRLLESYKISLCLPIPSLQPTDIRLRLHLINMCISVHSDEEIGGIARGSNPSVAKDDDDVHEAQWQSKDETDEELGLPEGARAPIAVSSVSSRTKSHHSKDLSQDSQHDTFDDDQPARYRHYHPHLSKTDRQLIQELQLSLGKQTHKLMHLELSNEQLSHTLSIQRRKLASSASEKHELQLEVGELKATLQEYKEAVETYEAEVEDLAQENVELKNNLGEQAATIASLNEDIEQRMTENKELKAEGEETRKRMVEMNRVVNKKDRMLTEERCSSAELGQVKKRNEEMEKMKKGLEIEKARNEKLNNAVLGRTDPILPLPLPAKGTDTFGNATLMTLLNQRTDSEKLFEGELALIAEIFLDPPPIHDPSMLTMVTSLIKVLRLAHDVLEEDNAVIECAQKEILRLERQLDRVDSSEGEGEGERRKTPVHHMPAHLGSSVDDGSCGQTNVAELKEWLKKEQEVSVALERELTKPTAENFESDSTNANVPLRSGQSSTSPPHSQSSSGSLSGAGNRACVVSGTSEQSKPFTFNFWSRPS
ncbi:hypothetical protein E1B28_009541 [Marasmius oreades]|uniref:Uncharacterized protein n=1 Tax=Marasmius oreades TaxID=181124 RepID=A0A9P7UQ80_9AGAR|nr:uncharacterized protein E1B28_009541 [Marasmius oreades]KAG7090422.1 hypothetical protein E1B28_009541 [Marasmius oreades]